jgi:hypothetical protein
MSGPFPAEWQMLLQPWVGSYKVTKTICNFKLR